MKQIYQVKIHGRTLESRDLRHLLARAVQEKRSMDRAFRYGLHKEFPTKPHVEDRGMPPREVTIF